MFSTLIATFLEIISIVSIGHAAINSPDDKVFYSDTVPEATLKFLEACTHANGTIETINHPNSGVQGELLQVSVCSVGNSILHSVFYTVSGTHGIEGYAGFMAQISMLRGPTSIFPPGIRMVHVHMLNPYGASHALRENEQNADHLKNEAGYYSDETVQQNTFVLFGQLNPKYGEKNVFLAFKTGQGKRRRGVAYFGPSKSWSTNTTEYIIDKYLRHAENILLVDWHTAVGPHEFRFFIPVDSESKTVFLCCPPQTLLAEYDTGTPQGAVLPYTFLIIESEKHELS